MIINHKNERQEPTKKKAGDLLDAEKINALNIKVVIKIGGFECGLETVCVETGLCRFDVCGKIDTGSFSDIKTIIDWDNNEHDPDDLYLD